MASRPTIAARPDLSSLPWGSTRRDLLLKLHRWRYQGTEVSELSRRQQVAYLALETALLDIDLEQFDQLHERWRLHLAHDERWLDYFNLADHLVRLAGIAVKLDLDRRPPLRILDLGCGGGLFGFLCRAAFGHRVVGLELPVAERPVNQALCRLLGQWVIEARLEPRRALPNLPGRFDLVTAISPQFHRIDRNRFWSVQDWAWFLGHLGQVAAGPEGAFYLKINRAKRTKTGVYNHDDLFAFARAQGATVIEPSSIIRFERLGFAA